MGTQDFFAIERDTGKVVAVHRISRNRICEPGSYRATLSYEAFRRREMRRAFPLAAKGIISLKHSDTIHWFSLSVKEHFDDEQEMIQKVNVELLGRRVVQPWENKPEVYHDSIWDFYKYIGYDYKRKRYITKI